MILIIIIMKAHFDQRLPYDFSTLKSAVGLTAGAAVFRS
jgi:hypothetical protein